LTPAHRALRAVVIALASCAALYGCDAVLGIPSDVVHDNGDGAADAAVDVSADATGVVDANGGGTDSSSGSDTGASDAGSDATVDASFDATPLCDLGKDFATPVMLTSVSTSEQEGSPRLSEDELTMTFDGVRLDGGSSDFDIFITTRKTITDTFAPATRIPGVNTADQEYAPNITYNGLKIFFERQTNADNVSRIVSASRATTNDAFDVGTPVANINTNNYTASPFVRGDGTSIFYVSVDAKPSIDVFKATFVTGTGYTQSQVLNAAKTEEQYHPVLSKDGLALYFGWDHNKPGFADVWVATRATVNDAFSMPIEVTSVNTANYNDKPGFISGDGCRLYLFSDRPGLGAQDIYVATRPQ
jgi:hypothetical protein